MQQLCDITQQPKCIMYCMLLLLFTDGTVLNDAVTVQIAGSGLFSVDTKRGSPYCSCRAVPCFPPAHSPCLLSMASRYGELD